MSQRLSLIAGLSLILAVSAPLGLVLKAEHILKTSPVIKIKIAGYDPRDLLYGHYLTYRYDWNWKGGKANDDACAGDHCCLCVGDSGTDPEVELMQCPVSNETDGPRCPHIIHGRYNGMNFFSPEGDQRYYVDERIGENLSALLRNGKETFRIGLGVTPGGKTMIEKLYIDDQTLSDYLTAHGGKVPAPHLPESMAIPVSTP